MKKKKNEEEEEECRKRISFSPKSSTLPTIHPFINPSFLPSFLSSFLPSIPSSVRPLIEGIFLRSVKSVIRNDPEAVSLTSNSQSPLRSMRRSIDKQTRGITSILITRHYKNQRSVPRTDRIAKLSTNYIDWIVLEQMWASWRRDEPHYSDPKHSINVTQTFKIHLDSFSVCLFPTYWPSTIALYSSYCDHKHEMRTGEVHNVQINSYSRSYY